MGTTSTIYKANKIYGVGAFLLPLLLIIPLFISDASITRGEIIGVSGFSLIAVLIIIAPMAFHLEVGNDYVKMYFLNFCVTQIRSIDTQIVSHSPIFKGNLGFGKGLIIYASVKGKTKRFTMGEKFYGKKAIDHVRRVLSPSR